MTLFIAINTYRTYSSFFTLASTRNLNKPQRKVFSVSCVQNSIPSYILTPFAEHTTVYVPNIVVSGRSKNESESETNRDFQTLLYIVCFTSHLFLCCDSCLNIDDLNKIQTLIILACVSKLKIDNNIQYTFMTLIFVTVTGMYLFEYLSNEIF